MYCPPFVAVIAIVIFSLALMAFIFTLRPGDKGPAHHRLTSCLTSTIPLQPGWWTRELIQESQS